MLVTMTLSNEQILSRRVITFQPHSGKNLGRFMKRTRDTNTSGYIIYNTRRDLRCDVLLKTLPSFYRKRINAGKESQIEISALSEREEKRGAIRKREVITCRRSPECINQRYFGEER